MSVSLCPDLCLPSSVCMVISSADVVFSTFPKGFAPDGRLVFGWAGLMNLPLLSLDLGISKHDF